MGWGCYPGVTAELTPEVLHKTDHRQTRDKNLTVCDIINLS